MYQKVYLDDNDNQVKRKKNVNFKNTELETNLNYTYQQCLRSELSCHPLQKGKNTEKNW